MKNFIKKIFISFLNTKEKFWKWFYEKILKIEIGTKLNKWQLIIFFILFPIKAIRFYPSKQNGFDVREMVWYVNGMKIYQDFFNHIAFGQDWFKIIKREDGIVTIKRSNVKEDDVVIMPKEKYFDLKVKFIEPETKEREIFLSIKY